MKKIIKKFTMKYVCFFILLFIATTISSSEPGQLFIYNWTYYIPNSVIEKFEKEYNVRVIYDEFSSNEEMLSRLSAGNRSYDLVFPMGDFVPVMIKWNMLEKIDKSRLPNLVNIDPLVIEKATHDPRMEYSVPYYYGAAGIIVNTAKVPVFDESWSIFARQDLRGRTTMLDDMRQVIGGALAYMGYSVNSTEPAEIMAARDLVNNIWKPNLTKFDADTFGRDYVRGNLWVVHGYAEVVFEEIMYNGDPQLMHDTYFFVPKEGGPAYLDSMCIPKGSKNIDLAHKFINFIHRPEIYAEFVDAYDYPSLVNIPARQYKKGGSWYSVKDLVNTESIDDIGSAQELYSDAWFNSIR